MGIKLVTFAAQTVTPQDDALIYETALQKSGMIYGGSVSIKNANVLHVEAGHGALCGRKFTIEATDVPVPLTPSGSLQGRIYIHMDLSDTGEPISFQIETASTLTPVVQQSDVNINSGIYEINLATFIVDTSTISNLVNVAPFIDIEPDSELSAQSNNPVQNKIITKAVGKPETIGGRASKPYTIGELILASDGQLYKATANIAQNATIVSGGNADPTGNIVSQISKIANADYTFGSSVSLKNYTSSANAYTFPSDGYLRFSNGLSSSGYADIRLVGLDAIFFLYAQHMGGYETRSVFVRKGMKMYIQHCDFNSNWNVSFNPIIPQ